MKTDLFDYSLPERLIAQQPVDRRDDSRLLVVHRQQHTIEHRHFCDLPAYLSAGDCLFRNNAAVIPARLHATRPTGGQVEGLLLRPAIAPQSQASDQWWCLLRPGKKLPLGATFSREGFFTATVLEKTADGLVRVAFTTSGRDILAIANQIGEMPLQVQSKILRVLQEGEFSRVGGNETLKTDVRIVCATNKNLEEEVSKRTFREDLFYRLNVVRIQIPPLRKRTEDVKLLAEYFLQKIANHKHAPPLKLSEEALRVMEAYPWPGNVRELENTLQRAAVMSTADILLPKDIPLGAADPDNLGKEDRSEVNLMPLERAIEVLFQAASQDNELSLLPWIEREFTLRAMQKTGDNQVRAAKLLGITRATLRKRLDRNSGSEDEEE